MVNIAHVLLHELVDSHALKHLEDLIIQNILNFQICLQAGHVKGRMRRKDRAVTCAE